MKEQLTIEDLCMYFPHKIRCRVKASEYYEAGEGWLCHLELTESLAIIDDEKGYCVEADISDVQPILLPLSSLTKPIVVEGDCFDKPFIPIEHLRDVSGLQESGVLQDDLSMVWDRTKNQPSIDLDLDSWLMIVKRLHQWHFWTGDQSYFEKGLIIEKGTI